MNNLVEAIHRTVPDDKVIADLRRIVWEEGRSQVELDEAWVKIPPDTPIGMVTKAFFLDRFDRPFGTAFRVMVAIGEILPSEKGTLVSQYCFSTLHYTEKGEFVTIDFHKELR